MGGNFRNHCDRGNFADFKRVSSGLSNANNATDRPAGRPAAFIKADDLRACDPKVSRSAGLRGVIRAGGRQKGGGERRRRSAKRETARVERAGGREVGENGKGWQLNAISRESNGSRLETRGSD